ncbi:DUF2914 domain-containing protein [Candidatus Nomurabacteria bacterium]|nr:DUF2914 domain-containing protein [Candidatus Nomurabacteria bacterium]
MLIVEPIRNWYGKYERPISSLSLIAGFAFDAFTLRRVDTLWENIWILGHLIIVGTFIVLIHAHESIEGDEKNPSKAHFWYVNILQFFFGGILSTYLVFYFRSADIFSTWPFILVLALAFIANESLKRHYVRFSFQISLFFLSVYSFAIFLVPVLMHQIGQKIFLLSGLASLIFITIFTVILLYVIKDKFNKDENESKKMIALLIVGIFGLVNLLYFTNLIPPIPLSLKDAGIYHSIQKNADGNYDVTYEDHDWREYFNLYPDFNETPGSPVYAFSAIFSPKYLNITVVHEWQFYDEAKGQWQTGSIVNLPVIGGRDGGFRTYSTRYNLQAGKWRVLVKTQDGQTIGSIRFKIIPTDTEPVVKDEIK